MEAQAKPQLRCYGRRNRSKSLKEGDTGPSANGQLQVDDRLPSPQASHSSLDRNISSFQDGKLPVGDQDMVPEVVKAGLHRNQNAGKEAEVPESLVCVQATEVLDELPPPRFKSEEEQVAYEEEVLWKADEIWARQEALEHVKRVAPKWKEPQHGKTHWDYLLQEMIWLANDFDKERKYKINLAKKLAHKAAKEKSEIALKGMRRVKTEEQRVRRIASNIAKEVKKFWDKIEKLVVYKHQLAVEEKKKKALDKHLDFLLGQTERYSSMLAVNLSSVPEERQGEESEMITDSVRESTGEAAIQGDKDFVVDGVEEEDDEATLEADEAMITEAERKEELDALERECELPLEELLRRYARDPDNEEEDDASVESEEDDAETDADTDDEESELNTADGGEEKDVDDKKCQEEIPAKVSDVNLQTDGLVSFAEQAKLAESSGDSSEEAKERMGEPSTSGRNFVRDNAKSKTSAEVDGQYADVLANVARAAQQRAERVRKRDENRLDNGKTGRKDLDEAAAAAQSAQPTGYTYSTTRVRTKLPFLLKHSLREYQHIGLDWLVTMYEKRLNGILADEMGLGKTIMTIALLAHLACEKGIWGPHLIVVPTSVMLNWETEFMKWCPAFKILTYFGSAKERKAKRQGWSKANSFHICITTYRLVVQDAKAFKRKKWKYLILDEAHLIKNWKSQRWQMLLNFNSKRRILLTGTPLQNDLMELWSLMHFLMPHVFQSHQEFKDWFSNPITGMIEGQEKVNQDVVDRLHNVLRPFILRRLKQDVEKQLPGKHEHVVTCRLSKRQRNLYEDFMASSDTQATLSSGNFLGLINVLMQLRKVCNHPDLFEGRPIISAFDMPALELQLCSELCSVIQRRDSSAADLEVLNLLFADYMESWEVSELSELATPRPLIEEIASTGEDGWNENERPQSIFEEIQIALRDQRMNRIRDRARHFGWLNMLRCSKQIIYGAGFRRHVAVESPVCDIHTIKSDPSRYLEFSSALAEVVKSPSTWCADMMELLQAFVFVIPAARAPPPVIWCSRPQSRDSFLRHDIPDERLTKMSDLMAPLRPVVVRQQLFFPDRRLLQFDCGKLQELSTLLRRLKSEGHRALIFTQMTKMLDILESFINLYGYTYMRLDGSTKPEQRQILMQRFNTNSKIFLFILSTRSGGVGINLVGADTVIFYDSDWNPAMDQQAQDRCHRIGQTREVHIYRLVSESTIEENILKKANQKRFLDDLVIQSGGYNTEFFKKLDPMELLSGANSHAAATSKRTEEVPSNADVDAALKSAEDEADYMAMKNVELEEAAEIQEFTEEVSVEDDECADDVEDGKAQSEPKVHTPEHEPSKENASKAQPMLMDAEEDMDMLADVKQLAAAAAASGRGSTYFEDQLKPIERYAIQFRDHWDPIISTDALETQVNYEEKEWELEQLEKLKEEQEAEIDEDEEPLLYESWDTAQADAVYKQQVEILAQQQESLEAEWEAMQEQEIEEEARHDKKAKKRKFKSIGKGDVEIEYQAGTPEAHASEPDEPVDVEVQCSVSEDMDFDMQWRFSRKRKLSEDELEYHNKRFKDRTGGYRPTFGDRLVIRTQGKKPVLLLERDLRKANSMAGTDPWVPAEEVVLCAVVNEYGDNWLLASDALDGMPEGERYRGRYRHPLKCKDRYRQLVIQNACGDSANAVLKLTEEDTKRLLTLVEQVPDNEMLLQRHFATILKVKDSYCSKSAKGFMSTVGQPRNFPFVSLADLTLPRPNQMVVPPSPKTGNALVAEALRSVGQEQENGKVAENKAVKRNMELHLSFPEPRFDDFVPVNVTLEDDEPELKTTELTDPSTAVRSQQVCENQFRLAANMTPSELADAACRLDKATREELPAPRRQSPAHDVTKQMRIKQARLQPATSPPSIAKNGMVEIRPVEIETTISPSLLRSAMLNESASIFSISHRNVIAKPSKPAAQPKPSTPAKTSTPAAHQKPAQSRMAMNANTNHTISSNKAAAVAAAAAAQHLPFAQYWRSPNIRPPVVAKAANHQQHSQVRQAQQQRPVQQRQHVQVKRQQLQQMPQRQQQQQQQQEQQQQQQQRSHVQQPQQHPRPQQQSQPAKSHQPRPQQQLHQPKPLQQSQQARPQQQLQQPRPQQQPQQPRPQQPPQQPRSQPRPQQQQVQHPRPQPLYQHQLQQPRPQQQFPQQPRPQHQVPQQQLRPAMQQTKPLLEHPRQHTQLLQQQQQLRQLQHQQAPDVSLSLTLGPPVQRKPGASQ